MFEAYTTGRSGRPEGVVLRHTSRRRGALPGIVGGIAAIGTIAVGTGYAQQHSPPPPSVVVAPVNVQDVTDRVQYIGNVEAMQRVDIRARVEGTLEKIAFSEGSFVQQNALLYQIDQAPYAAALAAAKATLAGAQAQLASARASLMEKQAALTRQTELAKQQFASQAILDQATAARDEAAAAVQQAQAQIESGNAQVTTATLNLSYTTIATPIAGRIGKTALTAGNLVSPSAGVLATIVQISPIRVTFAIPERDYVSIMRFLANAGAQPPAGSGAQPASGKAEAQPASSRADLFKPELRLPDGSAYPTAGKIEFVNNEIDRSTGTIAVRAVFDNPEGLLLPGEYVSVTVQTGQSASSPVVPQTAVQRNAEGTYVFVVDSDNKAQVRPVLLGVPTGTGYAVASGLVQGEMVIVNGVQKVRPGIRVQPVSAPSGPEGKKP